PRPAIPPPFPYTTLFRSEYAASAKHKIEIGRDQLAGKEMEVGRYYMNRKDFTGAINRFKIVVTQYQTTRHVEEALMRLTEAYMRSEEHTSELQSRENLVC